MIGITMFSDDEFQEVISIRVERAYTWEECGSQSGTVQFFPVSSPAEVVTRIETFDSEVGISILVRESFCLSSFLFFCKKSVDKAAS